MKFKVTAVKASQSRDGGSNITCQEVVVDPIFGECNGKEFIIQSAIVPPADMVGKTFDRGIRLEPVKYSFLKDGETVNVEYTRGVPY